MVIIWLLYDLIVLKKIKNYLKNMKFLLLVINSGCGVALVL